MKALLMMMMLMMLLLMMMMMMMPSLSLRKSDKDYENGLEQMQQRKMGRDCCQGKSKGKGRGGCPVHCAYLTVGRTREYQY